MITGERRRRKGVPKKKSLREKKQPGKKLRTLTMKRRDIAYSRMARRKTIQRYTIY